MKVMVVCGFGLGSSMILKMKVDEVLKEAGIKITTFTADMTTAKGESFDAVVTSNDLASMFAGIDQPVVVIDNFLDKDEVQEKALPVIRELLESSK